MLFHFFHQIISDWKDRQRQFNFFNFSFKNFPKKHMFCCKGCEVVQLLEKLAVNTFKKLKQGRPAISNSSTTQHIHQIVFFSADKLSFLTYFPLGGSLFYRQKKPI